MALEVLESGGAQLLDVVGVDLDDEATRRRDEPTTAVQQGARVPSDTDVAVDEQKGLPASLGRQTVEDRSAECEPAQGTGQRDRARCDVDPEGEDSPAEEFSAQTAWPAADVEDGTDAAFQHGFVGDCGPCVPAVDRHPDTVPARQPQVHRPAGRSQSQRVRILLVVVQLVLVNGHGVAPRPAAGWLSSPRPVRRARRSLSVKATAEAAKSTPVIASHRPR